MARRHQSSWCSPSLGLGLLTKFSIVFCGIGLVAAIVATPLRRALLTRWPWIALVVALAIGSPSVIGQIALGYPMLRQMHDLQGSQLQRMSAAQFLVGQLLLGPAVALACIGAGALLFATRLRAYRSVGLACATSFVLLMLLHGKAYYVGCAGAATCPALARSCHSAVRDRDAALRAPDPAAGQDGTVRGTGRPQVVGGDEQRRDRGATARLRRHARLAGADGGRLASVRRAAAGRSAARRPRGGATTVRPAASISTGQARGFPRW